MKTTLILIFLPLTINMNTFSFYKHKENKFSQFLLTRENVFYWLKRYDVDYTGIVLRQSLLETGNYTSTICKENNNLFGMKLAKIRNTTAIGENRNHAKYTHWIESIKDYKLYQEYNKKKIKKSKGYYDFLHNNGYSTNKTYIKTLKTLK